MMMRPTSGRRNLSFWRDRSGAVAVYVTVLLALLFAMVGTAVDFGRYGTTHTQAIQAADAAALAAALQLDGRPDSISRATLAAQGTPIIQNGQSFATSAPAIAIAQIRFFHSLPPDTAPLTSAYETTDPERAAFVEVTTETLSQNNWFIPAVGAASIGNTNGVAVAGYKKVVCKFPPLMMCNPFETAIYKDFPIDSVRGTLLLAKTKGGGSSAWVPGDFGLLDPSGATLDTTTNSGAKTVAEMIAATQPAACFESPVTLRPGVVDSMRTALNVRFDMYENPFFGNAATQNKAEFRPSANVVKGMTGPACDPTASAAAQKMPRANATRYDFYRHEIDNAAIPDNSATGGEDGNPQCYSGSEPPVSSASRDRRTLYMAVINCIEEGPLSGASSSNIRVKDYVKMFITEPVGTGSETDVFLEFIDAVKQGDGVLHEIVQLYR
jgi:Flp pilus assembly protein TadG